MSRLSAELSSATQHTLPPEFGRKWGTECLSTKFPLPTLLCAGYSIKLILIITLLITYSVECLSGKKPDKRESGSPTDSVQKLEVSSIRQTDRRMDE